MCYHKDITAPANIQIPGGLKDGHQITIYGKVSDSEPRFSINFKKDESSGSDNAFHFNPRNDQQAVVRNTYVNGWQHEERDIPNFPFANGQEFKVHIIVTADSFEVYVNTNHYCSYQHRINHHDMHYLHLTEGAEYHEVYIREKCRVPYNRDLPELSDGMCVQVRGLIHTDAHRFEVNFMCDANREKIALHCNPRQDQGDTVLNSFINGSWGTEERGFSYFPFIQGEFFDLSFVVHEGSFIISANGQHLASYAYRVPLENVRFLNVIGDIALMNVVVYDQLLNDWVKPIHGGLQIDDMISVDGFFKPNVDRFQINLLTGTSNNSERALHVNPRRSQNEVVLNNTECGAWQTEVKYPLPAELQNAVPFIVDIVNKESGFDIYINDAKVGNFPHRDNVDNIKAIYCSEDAYFHSIKVSHKLSNPHVMKTAGTPTPGAWCSILGIPNEKTERRFIIDIKNGDEPNATVGVDILFHNNPRFSEGQTVRNTLENGHWGVEERDESAFPFELNNVFEINTLLTESSYKVVSNGKHHFDYHHRIPHDRISHVVTRLDADFYEKETY